MGYLVAGLWVGVACGAACSSSSGSSGGSTPEGGGDDATSEVGTAPPSDGGADSEAGQAESSSSAVCDASLRWPMDGAAGTACAQCLTAQCASGLAMCQGDCLCASSIECLVVHSDNYTLCPDALSAIGAGNPGLTAVAGCIAMSCVGVCNGTD